MSTPDSENSSQLSRTSLEKRRAAAAANEIRGDLIQNADLITAKGNVVTKDGTVVGVNRDDKVFGEHIFQDPEVAEHYRIVYEKAQYECRHVFDPELTWTEEEEKRLVRKLDWRGMCIGPTPLLVSLTYWSLSMGLRDVLRSPGRPGQPGTSNC